MERILLSDTPNLGALSEFITLLDKLQNDFELQTVSINFTDTENRNMFAELRGDIGTIKLDFNYYDSKFYIISYNKPTEKLEKIKSVIKDFIK
ncbi:TPA: hypothetical protein I9073_003124 [Clostridium perfringens]|nr:hypothetical protein [Clostridium perfringens]